MTDMNRPLVQKMIEFKESNPLSLHVPGHKGGLLSQLPMDVRSALSYDLTELEGLDDLHEPTGVIYEAEQKLTRLYGAGQSFFLVNGSTVGNLAMIYAVCQQGDTVIVQRNAHKSVFNALELTGAAPVLITPEWDSETCTACTINARQIGDALDAYPEAKAVILTYPTYYGKTGEDLEKTIQLCHDKGIPVLVDEAHGAHFIVGEPFPRSALQMGADVVVHSAHKTLPAMTMASFLHVRSKLVSAERVSHYLRMLQSSSPSYLLMASLDDARAYAEEYSAADIREFMNGRHTLIGKLRKIPRLQVIETEDPLKLMIRIEGLSGFDLQEKLDAAGVFAELADPYQVLFVLPLLKKEVAYPFDQVCDTLEAITKNVKRSKKVTGNVPLLPLHETISTLSYTARELAQLPAGWMPYDQTTGMVTAASIIPYPPGIPLLLAGEEIKESHIRSLDTLLSLGANFQGAIQIENKQILVVMNGAVE